MNTSSKTKILDDLYNLGKNVAFRGFKTAVDTAFNVYKERCVMKSNIMLKDIEPCEIDGIFAEGWRKYNEGFTEGLRQKKLSDILDEIKQEKF